jgi:hypothetical protein
MLLRIADTLADRRLFRPQSPRDSLRDHRDARRTFAISVRKCASFNEGYAECTKEIGADGVEAEPRVRLRLGVRLLLGGKASHPHIRAQERRCPGG